MENKFYHILTEEGAKVRVYPMQKVDLKRLKSIT